MSWAQRLKRMFAIEIEKCERRGGEVKIIARIEDDRMIGKILTRSEIRGINAILRRKTASKSPFCETSPSCGLRTTRPIGFRLRVEVNCDAQPEQDRGYISYPPRHAISSDWWLPSTSSVTAIESPGIYGVKTEYPWGRHYIQ
jgi:hypothetical protein